MRLHAYSNNCCKSPFVGSIGMDAFSSNHFHLSDKYLLYGESKQVIQISVIPSTTVLSSDILLPSIVMEAASIRHGEFVTIEAYSCDTSIVSAETLKLELSSLSHYVSIPLDDINQLEDSQCVTKVLHRYYDHSMVQNGMIFLIPIMGTFLKGVVTVSSSCILTPCTQIHLSMYREMEVPRFIYLSESAEQFIRALDYTLQISSIGNDSVRLHGLAICGDAGSGKSYMMRHILHHINTHLGVDCSILLKGSSFLINDPIQSIEEKQRTSGSIKVVAIDDLDETLITEQLFSLFSLCFARHYLLIVTLARSSLLPSIWYKDDRFNGILPLFAPTQMVRKDMLKYYLKEDCEEEIINLITEYCAGYSYRDLMSIIKQIRIQSMHLEYCNEIVQSKRMGNVKKEEVVSILHQLHPSSLLGLDLRKSKQTLSDFGGYKKEKQKLMSILTLMKRSPQQLASFHITPASGILLYGPSGCGKSFLIPSVIGEMNSYYIYIECPSLFSKYFSETEMNIRRVFALARSVSPCILVFDQLEVLAGKRTIASANDGGFNERVVTTLLTELDGIDGTNTGVTIIGIVNDKDNVDDAIIRPGRLGTHIYMGKPTSEDREAILDVVTRSMPISADLDLKGIANRTEGCTGADLRFICNECALLAMREGNQTITMQHFNSVLHSRQQ